jgi:hypothetical protein
MHTWKTLLEGSPSQLYGRTSPQAAATPSPQLRIEHTLESISLLTLTALYLDTDQGGQRQ